MKPYYYSLDEYNKATFGRKLYKLSLSGGTTCPNRDGAVGTGGCIFCSAGGSGEFTPDPALPVAQQLTLAKERVRRKIREDADAAQYIAYFQSFTGTYAPPETLRQRFTDAVEWPQTAVLDVATRPDCLPLPVLDLLQELRQQKPLWIELGLQTANPETARLIRRGYDNDVYVQAVRDLHKRGITVVAHMILGLPGESREDMLRTVDFINRTGADGVKLQLLHVLRGTALADMPYTPLSMDAYIDTLLDCVAHLRRDVVIHRLTGDGDKRLLLSPLWSADKKRVLNAIHARMRERGVAQGEFCTDG